MISETELAELSYAEAPKIVTKIPDPKAEQLIAQAQELQTPTRMAAVKSVTWEEARGATLKDVDGTIFIEAVAGVGVSFVGSVNTIVVETIKQQAPNLMRTGNTVGP